MTSLERQIRKAIREDRWTFTLHAEQRLEERGIEDWQVLEGIEQGLITEVSLGAKPNPKIAVEQVLADGTPIIAVWAWVESIDAATLITVYFRS